MTMLSVGCLMGCFSAPPPWRKTAPLKRPIKRLIASLASSSAGFAHITAGFRDLLFSIFGPSGLLGGEEGTFHVHFSNFVPWVLAKPCQPIPP